MIEKPVDEEPVQLKIPVNKYICVVPIKHIDPKPKIEKIVENPDKVRYGSVQHTGVSKIWDTLLVREIFWAF